MGRRKKKKLNKKQEETIERMKKTRQLDNVNLRSLIEKKLKWAVVEKEKGIKQAENLKIQIARLDGIILFIKDLLSPVEDTKEEKK